MLEGILHLCIGSMVPTCVELYWEYLQNFVGNISTLLKFVRKISTHGARYKTSYDCAGIILTHVRTFPTLYLMCIGTNSTMCHTKFLNVALHV